MRRLLSLVLTAVLATAVLAAVPSTTAGAASPSYTVTPMWFRVTVGTGQTCTIVADRYTPKSASVNKQVPAILTTNGFGGSKDDQAGLGRYFASRGYVVLSYSGLGFGGSGCKITLDDPQVDGVAASRLIDYLGGKGGGFLDEKMTRPAPKLPVVKRDAVDHLGKKQKNDPRVGMVGVSYGGGIQFATAAVDPRLDTIIPGATWNDLSYSLSPNNTAQTTGVSTSTPGAAKLVWALGFTGLGIVAGLSNAQVDPSRTIGCPNFADFVCPGVVTAGLTGAVDAATTKELRQRSVASYVGKVRIPTLLLQGQSDTLFNLNESVATFQALRARKVPTKLVWINGGHSGPNAPGEIDFAKPNPSSQHLTARITAWFDHYLKGAKTDTGPLFSYFRDWVSYTGTARPAYATSTTFPVGSPMRWYLSGSALTTSKTKIQAGSQSLLTGPLGAPTSIDTIDVAGDALPLPEIDLPGTFAAYTGPRLTKPIDVVGSPTLDLAVQAPTALLTQSLDPATKLVLFVKVLDVGPDGKGEVVRDLVAPVRVPDASKPFRVTLPGFVHRFEPGHAVKLVVAGGSVNYRGGLVPAPVTIATGSSSQVLSLPVVR